MATLSAASTALAPSLAKRVLLRRVWEKSRERRSQFDSARMCKVAQYAVLKFTRLANERPDESRVAVAKVAGPPGRDPIHVPVARSVEKIDALSPGYYRKSLPGRRVLGVRVPEACPVDLLVFSTGLGLLDFPDFPGLRGGWPGKGRAEGPPGACRTR